MSQPFYTQYKRTGAYTLFVDESEMGRTNTGDTAIHLLIGQSRYGSAPVNTLVRIQDPTELLNTFGGRDTWMERRGCFFINHALTLLQQGPIFAINLQTFDDTKQKVETVSLKPAKDGKYVFDKSTQVPLTSVYDRTGFWKVDRDLIAKNVDDADLIGFSTFNTKSNSIIVRKADMSNTEFETITVADYNANNPNRKIECVPGNVKMADLFFRVDVFGTKLVNDLKSGFNTKLTTWMAAPTGTDFISNVLGDTAVAQNANLTALINEPSTKYMDSYVGTVIPNVYSSLNDAVSLDKVFNADSRLHGMVATINEKMIEDWTFAVDDGDVSEILEYFEGFEATTGTPPVVPVKPQVIDVRGAVTDKDQLVDDTKQRQNLILDLVQTRGLKSGILDYKKNDFFYLVDSFKTYLEPNSKWQLAKLAEESKRFAYLYSAPFMKDFTREATYQDNNGIFDPKYIAQGGNPDVQDPVLYSMPGEGNGDYATIPFAGDLVYDDGNSQVVIPSNVCGAIAYGAKHLSATKKPYTIVNGPNNGTVNMINIVDTAYGFTDYDRDYLEPFGWNLILKSDTVFQIYNDATAKNIKKSSVSYASNYELITYVAREGRIILDRVVGERNNDVTRLRVKTQLDGLCNRLRAEGVIERYENTCNETNNTAAVRQAGILLADTVLWTADGIKIAVHRITVKLKSDTTGVTQ